MESANSNMDIKHAMRSEVVENLEAVHEVIMKTLKKKNREWVATAA